MARELSHLAPVLVLLLVFQAAFAANYEVDLIWPETGTTGTTLSAYQQWRVAAEMARDAINAEWATTFPSNQLVVNFKDNANNAATSMNLVQQSTAAAVVGAGSDAMTESAALALQNAKTPVLAPILRAPTDSSIDNLFTLQTPYIYPQEVTAAFLARFNWTQVGIIYSRDAESTAIRNAFKAQAGLTVLAELEVPTDTLTSTEYQNLLNRFTTVSVNIYIVIVPETAKMPALMMAAEVITGLFGVSKAWFFMNQPAANIPLIPAGSLYYQARSGSPTSITNFTTALRDHTGNSTAVLQKDSMWVYDAFVVIARALVATNGATGQPLRDNIKASTIAGVTGNISFRSADGRRMDQRCEVYNALAGPGYNPPAVSTRIPQLSFVYDDAGITDVNATVIWPGSTTVPTSGIVSIWPMAFLSKIPTVSVFGVPFNGTISRYFARWMMNYINDRSGFLPLNTRVSMPSIDDTGTQGGAVRLVSTFPSFGFVGIIGTDTSEISSAIQLQLSANSIPQISHGATATLLSDKVTYPTFFRTVPADDVQTLALVELAQYWGWDNVGVISTASIYGTDLSATFLTSANALGLRVSQHVAVPEGSNVIWTDHVQLLKDNDVHIAVVLGEPEDVFEIVRAAKAIGYKPRAWIAAASFFTSPYIATAIVPYGLTMSDFNGFVGAAAGLDLENPTYLSFKANLSNPIYGAQPELIRQCDIVPLYCAYVYDSVFTLAHAIKNMVLVGGNPRNQTQMLAAIRQVDVQLTTGRVHFDNAQDRLDGQYSLLNFVGETVTQVGTWTEANGAAFSRAVVWPDGSTNIPAASDPPTINWLKWDSAGAIVLAVLAAIGILLAALICTVVIYQNQSPIIRTATWEFLIIILLGIALGFGSMYTWIGEPRPWICALRIWLPPLAYVMIMAPLLAKTWRLHKIFTLGSLKLVPIPFWKLSLIAFGIFLVQVIICIVWISLGTIQTALVADPNARNTYDKVCAQKDTNRILSYVTYGYCAFITLAGAYLAFVVRKLPKDFNESRWIGFSMYNSVLFGILIIILGFSLADFKRTVLILICCATLAITTGVMIFMFFPKLWDLWRHPEKRSGSGRTRKTTSGSGIVEENTARRHNYSKRGTKTSSHELSNFERGKNSSEAAEPARRRHNYSLASANSTNGTSNGAAGTYSKGKKK